MLNRIAGLVAATAAFGFAAAPASAQDFFPEDLEGAWEIVLNKYDEGTPWGGIVFRDDQTGCMSYFSESEGPRYMAIIYTIDGDGLVMQSPDEDPQELAVHLAGDDILVMTSRTSLEYGDLDVEVFRRSNLFDTCGQLRTYVTELE